MAITLDGTTGITTPGITNTGTTTIVDLTTTGNTTLGDATTDTLTVGVTGIVKDASGNVGIGTASPAFGGFGSNTGGIQITNSNNAALKLNGNAGGDFYLVSGSSQHWLYATGAVPMSFATNGSERMRIDSSGNVGIGTSSPNTKLQASAGSSGSGVVNTLRLQNVGTSAGDGARILFTAGTSTDGAGIASTGVSLNAADLRFYSGSSAEAARFDTSGNLGIGLSSLTEKFEVNGSINVSTTSSVNFATGNQRGFMDYVPGSTQVRIGHLSGASGSTTGVLAMLTNGAERARIDSSGNLLVGATASANSTYSIATFRGSNKGIAIQDSSTGNYRAIYGQSGGLYFYNGSNEGYLSSAGAWTNASDARLKNSIVDIKYGLSAVMNTQPRSYKMNDLDGDYVGFVAQELQQIIPEVVSGNPEKQLGVDYGSLVAVAFKAIQEQQALIQSLTTRLTALENK